MLLALLGLVARLYSDAAERRDRQWGYCWTSQAQMLRHFGLEPHLVLDVDEPF